MTTRAQHKSDPIDFEGLQNSYTARKLRKKNIIEQYISKCVEILLHKKKCNFRKPKFKLSNDMTPTTEFDEKNSYKMPFFSP